MNLYEIKRLYNNGDRTAALKAYPEAIKEHGNNEEIMNELAFLAADYSDAEALGLLFEAGVSPAVADKYKFTLLHYLARQPESTHHARPAGAVAETTALLMDSKLSVRLKDENEKMTCYHYAARNGLLEMVEEMVKRGARLSLTDREGNTGIHIACDYVRFASPDKKENFFRVVRAFAEGGVDIGEKNDIGWTALDIAIKSDAKKIAAYLSGTLSEDGTGFAAGGMTFHQAAEKGDVEAIKAIADTGADINALKDGEEYRNGGCTPLAIAVLALKAEAVEALLACGADPAFRDGSGRAAVSFILRSDVNGPAFEENRIPKIINDIIGAGMDIDMPVNDDSDTLLILACKSQRGYAYKRYTHKGEVIGEAIRHNPNVNLANRFGETALMHACSKDFEVMENTQVWLLEQGADVAAADQNGDTALHYAARNYDNTAARTLCDTLLEFGADPNATNNAGETALDIATKRDNEPLVKLLLGNM